MIIRQFPEMAEAGLQMLYPAIAEELFGEEVYPDPDNDAPLLAPHVVRFLDSYMAIHWHALRSQMRREHTRMTEWQHEIDKEWACECLMF